MCPKSPAPGNARGATLRVTRRGSGRATMKRQPFTESGLTRDRNGRLMRTVRRREGGRPARRTRHSQKIHGGRFMSVVASTFVIGIVIGAVGVFLFRGRRDP